MGDRKFRWMASKAGATRALCKSRSARGARIETVVGSVLTGRVLFEKSRSCQLPLWVGHGT